MKTKVQLTSLIQRTPGRNHFWCDSNVGIIRKHINNIPEGLLKEYREEELYAIDFVQKEGHYDNQSR